MTEGAPYDPTSKPDATGLSHPGGLSFIHESELDKEVDAPVVGDVPPADEPVLYEAKGVPEEQPTEVPEPVGVSVYRQENSPNLLSVTAIGYDRLVCRGGA